jgi:hypothetical protein
MKAAPGMNAPELFEQYRRLSEEELEQLLREFGDLLETAQSCLIAELRTRGQTDETISATIEAGRKLKLPLTLTDGFDPDLTKKIGSVSNIKGIGRIFYGKTHLTFNETFAFEEFDTTLWWIFFLIPLIPEGSFRIRRKQEDRLMTAFSSYSFVVVQRIPFLWVQNIFRLILAITFLSFWGYPIISAILRQL